MSRVDDPIELGPPNWGYVGFISILVGLFIGTGLFGSITGLANDLGRDASQFQTAPWYFSCWALGALIVLPFQLRSDRRTRERQAVERAAEADRVEQLRESARSWVATVERRRASGRACLACAGTGEVTCDSCRGSRRQRCPACHGAICDRCDSGEVDCSRCGGHGDVRCTRCGGAGLEK